MPAKSYNKRPHFEGYRLTAEISANAFSRVLLAERISSISSISSKSYEQPIAIKWLHATPMSVQQDRDSFQREIHSLRSLHYPHIVPILVTGFLEEDNTPYLVMEYASNGSLSERLQDRQPLFHDEALAILDQIGQALYYAHQWNITHGNLKPQNILFDAADDALLTDFHLNSVPQRSVTSSDEASVYIAPEQLTGQASPQSDIYALGCIAYEMFTGHKPFMTPSMTRPGIYYRTRKASAPRMLNPLLSQSIEDAILQAIAKEPDQRQSDIPALLAALRGFDSIREREKGTTLPTLPIAITPLSAATQVQYTTDIPESRNSIDTTTVEESTSSSREQQATPVGVRDEERALVSRASSALLPLNSGSVKQHLRHYLAVPVLLTYLMSFKRRLSFLPAISMTNNTLLSHVSSITNNLWLNDIRNITRNRLRLKRPGWAFIITASLLLAGMIGMLTLLLFSSHAPQGKSLAQATSTQIILPQLQPDGTPTLVSTVGPHSTPAITTTNSITFALTPIPSPVSTSLSKSTTSSTSISSDTSNSSSSSSSSISPTSLVTPGITPTSAPNTQSTPTSAPQPTPTPTSAPQPTPTPTPIPPTPTPTPLPVSSCRVSYTAPSQWQQGFGVNMVITNTGRAPINGWTLNFAFPGNQHITSGWGGRFSQRGNQVTVTDAGYNAQISTGSSVNLGFLGTWSSNNSNPTSFTLNGVQCH
jgi:serine/threonine protein kinase